MRIDRDTAEQILLIAVIGSPLVASTVAGLFAIRCDHPEEAKSRGFHLTWGLTLLLGVGASVAVDLMFRGYIIPACCGAVEILLVPGALLGWVVGMVAGAVVRRRTIPKPEAKPPEAGGTV
jgi:hypothetical protein